MSMKQLWAPWRMEFIQTAEKQKDDRCVFCRLDSETGKERENLILYRSGHMFVILNKFPYNNGHLMVVPHRHTADYVSLSAEELGEMHHLSHHVIRALTEAYGPQGFNVGMNLGGAAGAGIREHLHLHVVPRWNGDTNFMPVLGETKSMPQHLLASYDTLHRYFSKL